MGKIGLERPCEHCKGKGQIFAVCILRSDGKGGPGMIGCPVCHGSGIDKTNPAWREEGRRLREWRLSQDRSMGEEARRRGLRPSEISDMEMGRRKPEWPPPESPRG